MMIIRTDERASLPIEFAFHLLLMYEFFRLRGYSWVYKCSTHPRFVPRSPLLTIFNSVFVESSSRQTLECISSIQYLRQLSLSPASLMHLHCDHVLRSNSSKWHPSTLVQQMQKWCVNLRYLVFIIALSKFSPFKGNLNHSCLHKIVILVALFWR